MHSTMYRKEKDTQRSTVFLFVFCVLFFISGSFIAHAAELSLDPNSGTYGPGETFVVTIRIDTESVEECINAIDAVVQYPKDLVKVVAVSKGESILSLWAQEPMFDQERGVVEFAGGIPGGYCGRVLGDPGRTNIVGKIVFNIPSFMVGKETPKVATPMDVIFASSSAVLLNDGRGTPAPLSLGSAHLVRAVEARRLTNEWLESIRDDTFPPDDFTVDIFQNKDVYEGKYFVVFNTTDKQSGVSRYEVMEDDPEHRGKVRGKRDAALYYVATSPYLLRDQDLQSVITVRAIDNAGNKREVVVEPKNITIEKTGLASTFSGDRGAMMLVGLLAVGAIGAFFVVRRKKNTREDAPY